MKSSTKDRIDQKRQVHMQTAFNYAELSRAVRLQVGAVLVKDDRPLMGGYNGMPAGWDDDTCEKWGDAINGVQSLETKREVTHAEDNVISYCAAEGVSTKGATLFITDSPCFECSKSILGAKIKEVVYSRPYRDEDAIKFLKKGGVKVCQLKP